MDFNIRDGLRDEWFNPSGWAPQEPLQTPLFAGAETFQIPLLTGDAETLLFPPVPSDEVVTITTDFRGDALRLLAAFDDVPNDPEVQDRIIAATARTGQFRDDLLAVYFQAIDDARRIGEMGRATGADLTVAQIREKLFRRIGPQMLSFLRKRAEAEEPDVARALREEYIDGDGDGHRRVQRALKVLGAAPFAHTDLREFPEFDLETHAPASDLRADAKLHDAFLSLVAKGYPEGDAEEFERVFLSDPHAVFHTLTCGENRVPVAGMGVEYGYPHGMGYVDWLTVNSRSRVIGISPAFYTTLLRVVGAKDGTFHAAKPFVRSLYAILAVGGVCDGLPENGDYKHKGYVQTRWHPKEQGAYPAKALGEAALRKEIGARKAELRDEEFAEMDIAGHRALVRKVEFKKMNHTSDADPEQHPFYHGLREQFAAGYVLTSYIPVLDAATNLAEASNQSYYAVLEKEAPAMSEKGEHGELSSRDRLGEAREAWRAKHAHGNQA